MDDHVFDFNSKKQNDKGDFLATQGFLKIE